MRTEQQSATSSSRVQRRPGRYLGETGEPRKPRSLIKSITGASFEQFVVRHELRRKKLRESVKERREEGGKQRHRAYFIKSERVFRLYDFSIAGTLNDLVTLRLNELEFRHGRLFHLRVWGFYRYWFLISFCAGYCVFCMPFHYWIKNKYSEILDSREATPEKRKKVVEMLGKLQYHARIIMQPQD